jgi:hypothetical protein
MIFLFILRSLSQFVSLVVDNFIFYKYLYKQ